LVDKTGHRTRPYLREEENMTSPALAQRVDSLLAEAEKADPVSYNLGTPVLIQGDPVSRLVDLGAEIVPYLIDVSRGDASSRRHAYVALVLGRIGEAAAIAPLRDLCARYQRREPKDEWDYAVIGQCNHAMSQLENSSP
jgi:hypothetical protein